MGSLAGPNQGYEDAWIAKYSRVGILLWKRQLGTSQIDAASGVAIDRNGNAYVSGNTQTYCVRCAGELNAWLVKYSASGSFIWKRQLPSGSRNSVSGVATDDKSYVYIAGWTTGSLGGPNQGSYDAWLAKYSPAGLLLWIQQLGTPDGDFARGLATDDKGGVYIVGDTDSISGDAWIAKYSGAGALL